MIKRIFTYSLIATTLFSMGCASIVSRSNYPLTINSTPTNAKVVITDKWGKEVFTGQTPVIANLKSGAGFFTRADYRIKFSAPGYSEKVISVSSKLNGWYWGNIVFGGLIGFLIVDPATGAMYRLETKELNETLNGTVVTNPNNELRIMGLNELPESLKNKLVKIN